MFDWVYIEKNPGRDITTLNLNLNEGLQGYNFFSYLFMVGALFFFIIALLKVRLLFPYVIICILFMVGFYMYKKSNNAYQNRIQCFLKGDAVTAQVVKQMRTFNPFSSKSKYAIVLQYKDKLITVEHKSEVLWKQFPLKTEVIGLQYNNNFLFGPEMGVDFKFFLEKNKH